MFKLERNTSKKIEANEFTATYLTPGEQYSFQVYSVNAQRQNGRTSASLNVITGYKKPLPVIKNTTTTFNESEVTSFYIVSLWIHSRL